MDNDRLRGISNQDQLFAEIASTWRDTAPDIQDEIMLWLEDDNARSSKGTLRQFPLQWIVFIQKCVIAGLREAVLREDAACSES